MKVNGKDCPIYEMENNPVMFETTNQKIINRNSMKMTYIIYYHITYIKNIRDLLIMPDFDHPIP
jgi:hypothetical protein